MARVALAVVLLLAIAAQPADARGKRHHNTGRTLLVDDRGAPIGGALQRWVDESSIPTPRGPLTVRLITAANAIGTRAAYTAPGLPIFVRTDLQLDRQQFLHEIGHQFDYTMAREKPAIWTYVRGLVTDTIGAEGREWQSPPNSPHEQFAEAYGWVAATERTPAGGYMAQGVTVGYGLWLSNSRASRLRNLLLALR